MFKIIFSGLLFCNLSLIFADYEIILESSNPIINQYIIDELEEFNLEFFKSNHAFADERSFVIYVKEEDKIIGGLTGYIFKCASSRWMHIDFLFVEKEYRGEKIGSNLLKKAEKLALEENLQYIQLFTFSYQAVKFYEKQGFSKVGVIPKWIDTYDAIFFRKNLPLRDIFRF